MARTVVGYIPKRFLNSAASPVSSGAVDSESGLPLQQGLTLGAFQEFGDGEALTYSNQGVIGVNLLTAGSGQTPGTYQVTANTGGAVLQYVVAAGGTVTAQPTILTPGGPYTDAAIPTFTLPLNGGTAATVQAVIGVLYSGTYQWVTLDPSITANVLPGVPLYFLQTATGPWVVTPTSTANVNSPDYAGVSIDPGFGPTNPYAFMQINGKARCLFSAAAVTYGLPVNLNTAAQNFVAGSGTTVTSLTVGYSLGVGAAAGGSTLVRINRPVVRF